MSIWAMLLGEGQKIDVFVMKADIEEDVQDFLQSRGPFGGPAHDHERAGIGKVIDEIRSSRGLDLPRGMFDSWVQDGERICEIIKGPLRVSCFRYGRRILLVHVFRKTKKRQTEAYMRALRLKRRFDENPDWRK